MKRIHRYLALALGGVGLAVCVAAIIAMWVVRPWVLRSSAEILDATDDSLKLQAAGLGGKRTMGCGIFRPARIVAPARAVA